MKPFDFKKTKQGTTFVELLLYIAIFLVLTPILLMVSINAVRTNRQYQTERQTNADSQFVVERVYDLISQAKKVDTDLSVFNSKDGVLALVMQDGASVKLARNAVTKKIEITEEGVKSDLTSANLRVEDLYFEKLADPANNTQIVLGVNVRLNVAPADPNAVVQNYVTSSNLEKGDYDNDGSPDYADNFPMNANCTMDADGDGICDELDNAVMAFNPFQEDFDGDGIGDVADSSIYILGSGHSENNNNNNDEGNRGSAFNCSSDQQLIDLINAQPPLGTMKLKAILMASSPLSPTVLDHLINKQDSQNVLGEAHFVDVMINNCKLPGNVLLNVQSMQHLPTPKKNQIVAAHNAATTTPWDGSDKYREITYDVDHPSAQAIMFRDANYGLGADMLRKTDPFVISVTSGTDTVKVTTVVQGGASVETTLVGIGTSSINSQGYALVFEEKLGVNYVFKVSSFSNDKSLVSVTFDFGTGATVTEPSGNTYHTYRFTYYCPGGCETRCGDVGTGIFTGNLMTDKCYKANNSYPEWCALWTTFNDDNASGSAYIGGTQDGEDTIYWEKYFKTILTQSQIDKLESITVTGQVAYQSTAQFFCDQFQQSCPMNGSLVGAQDVQLYNWQTNTWVTVGVMALDGTKSDQQSFEVVYKDADAKKFVGGEGSKLIKARMPFHWDGNPPQGQTSASSFMLIDYFVIHMKW